MELAPQKKQDWTTAASSMASAAAADIDKKGGGYSSSSPSSSIPSSPNSNVSFVSRPSSSVSKSSGTSAMTKTKTMTTTKSGWKRHAKGQVRATIAFSSPSSRQSTGKKLDRFFRWRPGEGNGDVRRNLSSADAHTRRVRIARAKGMDKSFVEQLTKDLKKEIMGPRRVHYMENCKRSMGAAVLRNQFVRFLHGKLSKAFFKWVSVAEENVPLKDIINMRTFIDQQHAKIGDLSDALTNSKNTVFELQSKNSVAYGEIEFTSKRLAEIESLLSGSKARLMFKWVKEIVHSRIRSSLRTWHTHVMSARKYEALVGRAVRRLLHRTLSRAFAGWHFKSKRQKRRRQMLQRAVAMFRSRLLGKSYFGWKSANDARKRQRNLLLRGVSRLKNRWAAKAFAQWTFIVLERKRRRQVLQRARAKWMDREKAGAFAGWRFFVLHRKRNRDILRRAGAKWMNRRLSKTWRRCPLIFFIFFLIFYCCYLLCFNSISSPFLFTFLT